MLGADGMRRAGRAPAWRSATRMSKRAGGIVSLLMSVSLGGCVETGDLGRPKLSVWNQTILPAIGVVSSAARGQPLSRFAYTDDEDELRARAWSLVMPAHERAYFERTLTEFVRTNILPKEVLAQNPPGYLTSLRWEGGRSPSSRYSRLTEDILAQRALLPLFCSLAARVFSADGTRLRAMPFVRDLTDEERGQANFRVAENRSLVVWVSESFHHHVAAFRHALEHLVIESPQQQAIEPERALAAYEETGACLDGLLPSRRGPVQARSRRDGGGSGNVGPEVILGK